MTRTSGDGRRRTGQRWREKWNAAPLRGLPRAQRPGASPPSPARRVGPFLGNNHPQTHTLEASFTPGPSRPCPRAAAPPYPAVCRLLPALSDLLIFHLTRRFPSSQPPPRACALIRASVAGASTQVTQWTPPPAKPRKRSQAGVQDCQGAILEEGEEIRVLPFFLRAKCYTEWTPRESS